MKESYTEIGKVKGAHGIRGELFIRLFANNTDWVNQLAVLCLAPKGQEKFIEKEASTFTVEKARPHKSGLIIQTKEIMDRTQAESFKGFGMFIPNSFLIASQGEGMYLAEVLGFHVESLQGDQFVDVGYVVGFMDNGVQDLLEIESKEKTKFLIPFVDAFIININKERSVIQMNLPDGLVDFDE